MTADRATSVLARLLNRAKARSEDYNLVLNRFVLERLLFRLSVSAHANSFLLKGAMLFSLWYDAPHRPTRDADLLGFGPHDIDSLRAVFDEVCAIEVDDGVRFDVTAIKIAPIREDTAYGGLRLVVPALIGNARLSVQVDVGFGDAVTPGPEQVSYPPLLEDLGAPQLRAYPVYTVIAEKFEAMVQLGMLNTRMKDFFDLAMIARNTALDGATLAQGIQATFARRGTALPQTPPPALTIEFSAEPTKIKQWQAFLSKAKLEADELSDVVVLLNTLLWPPTQATATGQAFALRWTPDGLGWQ
jgi:hypothetical protein